MDLKILILGVSVVLMAVVVLLSVAGIVWALDAPISSRAGAFTVLAISGGAAVACLCRLWATRRDHLR